MRSKLHYSGAPPAPIGGRIPVGEDAGIPGKKRPHPLTEDARPLGVNVTAFSGAITTNANLLQIYGTAAVTSAVGQLLVSTQAIDKGGYGVTIIASNITTNANLLQIYGTAAVTSAGGQLRVSTQAIDKGGYGVTTIASNITTNANVIQVYGSAVVTSASGQFLVSTQTIDKSGYGVTSVAGTTNANLIQVYGSAVVTSAAGVLNVSTQTLSGGSGSVDVLLSEGRKVYAGITRDLTQPNHLKEAGSQMPPAFPADKQAEMVEFAERVLNALEFINGAFHVELKYTSNGPRLIEVNARIGGGPIYYFHRHVWGVDLVKQYLLTCLGVPIRPQQAEQPLTCLITSDLPSPVTGVVNNVDFLNPIKDHPLSAACQSGGGGGAKNHRLRPGRA